ncbi:50S ribosomal protein L9 [Candidatus Azambacteria bacterium]|nr:50S ribosomal protein L9 [Candidatus Azambacteria bacterium]
MKVIFKKDIKNIAKVGDIKDVSDGYAKNFLFKNNLAVTASEGAIRQAEDKKASDAQRMEKARSQVEELSKKLNGFKIKAKLKFGDGNDTSFGSVSAQNISDMLKDKGFEIETKNILLDSNIKTLGEHKVKIKLGFNFEPAVSVVVEKE